MRVLVTNATQYAGPGVVDVLCRQGHEVLCHDASFGDAAARAAFAAGGAVALAGASPEEMRDELAAHGGEPDAIVSNDVFAITPGAVEELAVDGLRASLEALLVFPFRLTQAFLPRMKARRNGAIVFVTSARELRPEPGYAVQTTVRAGTTAFARALAKEVAPFEVQVNVVAPNFLASETYYPRAKFVDDPAGRAAIAQKVPFGRLGAPEEIGELVAFLVSGRSKFTTGQTLYFTGGWP